MSRSFWRVSTPDGYGNPVSYYVEDSEPGVLLSGDGGGSALTELAWQEVFRRLREETETA